MLVVEDDNVVYEPFGGGEPNLIAGMAFVSIGLSCKQGFAGQEPPPVGTPLKLSMKMQAFHAMELIDGGIQGISHTSISKTLDY